MGNCSCNRTGPVVDPLSTFYPCNAPAMEIATPHLPGEQWLLQKGRSGLQQPHSYTREVAYPSARRDGAHRALLSKALLDMLRTGMLEKPPGPSAQYVLLPLNMVRLCCNLTLEQCQRSLGSGRIPPKAKSGCIGIALPAHSSRAAQALLKAQGLVLQLHTG